MSNKALAALRAKKANQGTANKAPTAAPKKIGEPTPAATVAEDGDDDDEDAVEEEVVAKPVKKPLPTKKPIGKPKTTTPPPVAEDDDNDDDDQYDEDGEGNDDDQDYSTDDSDVPTDDEDGGDDQDYDDDADADDDEVEPEPEPTKTKKPLATNKKTVAKPAKAPAVKAKTAAAALTATPKASGGLFGSSSKAEPKERRVFSEGDHITREEVIRRFAESRGISQADAQRGFADVENFMLEEIFPMFAVTFFGVKFRRTPTEASYREGAGGLNVKTDGLVTEISPHIAVRACITIGKTKRKGKFIKNEFVPGHVDAKGKFVRDED